MKKEEVPQDDAQLLQGKMTKLYYATLANSDSYMGVRSVGWEAENVVLEQAWENITEQVAQARLLVENGTRSILYYHMQKQLMDTAILAGYIGWPAWVVNFHFSPFFFNLLGQHMLKKYAYAFRLPLQELQAAQKGDWIF